MNEPTVQLLLSLTPLYYPVPVRGHLVAAAMVCCLIGFHIERVMYDTLFLQGTAFT